MENPVIIALKKHIQELGIETRKLVKRRDEINMELHDIDIRLTHITGAMGEMSKIIKKEEENEVKNSSKPTVDSNIQKTNEMQSANGSSVQNQEDSSDS